MDDRPKSTLFNITKGQLETDEPTFSASEKKGHLPSCSQLSTTPDVARLRVSKLLLKFFCSTWSNVFFNCFCISSKVVTFVRVSTGSEGYMSVHSQLSGHVGGFTEFLPVCDLDMVVLLLEEVVLSVGEVVLMRSTSAFSLLFIQNGGL
jgi:hypothetical protein